MATQIPETVPVPILDTIASAINQTINRLIYSLEQRKRYLLTTLRDKREEMKANQLALKQVGVVAELEAKRAEFKANTPLSQEIVFTCDTQYIDEHIARLGEVVKLEISPMHIIPNYAAFQQPTVAVGKKGNAPGELNKPQGFFIQPETGHIYLADRENSRIQMFSSNGDYINLFQDNRLLKPYGILIHQDNMYVTDTHHHAMFQFSLPDFTMIGRVGGLGPDSDKFNKPKQLALSPNQLICVADENNDRLQILTPSLSFQGSLQHQTMTRPSDVKFSHNEVFVLSCEDNPCIHVFGITGDKSRSIVSRGDGMQVEVTYFFCLDNGSNIIITDWSAHCIKVFSPEGKLICTIGEKGHEAGKFQRPKAISIFDQNKVVCFSNNSNCGLQIFSA